jgi:hypothetical protein
MGVIIRRGTHRDAQLGQRLIDIEVGLGLNSVDDLQQEIMGYVDILLGRGESPIDSPYLAMMEVATAYYARAQELDMIIHSAEREGAVMRGSQYYKFRTGELKSFIELARKCADLGSRRLTQEDLLERQRYEE